jgi:hypothetical protein
MISDGKTLQVKCNNTSVHNNPDKEPGEGNILAFFRGNSIYIKCSDHRCKRWNKITINLPGCNLDFSNAGFIQTKMSKKYHFDAIKAPVVIEEQV